MNPSDNSNDSSSANASTSASTSTSSSTWSSWFGSALASTVENAQILAANTVAKAQVIAEQAQPFIQQATKVAQEKASVIAQETKILYDQSLTEVNKMATQYQQSNYGRGGDEKSKNGPLDLQYITENIISMSFPADAKRLSSIPGSNDINRIAAHLKTNHGGHFMIWNISEESYDYSLFDDQVLEYKFPGHPSPPLYLIFKICTSIQSWLDADERNVAVIHCLTGKGRTTTLMACVLAWIGEFSSPAEALYYIADMRKIPVEFLTIPSQKRYIQYFSNTLMNERPRSEPLILRRILFNTIPVFGNRGENGGDDMESNYGCCPYIQLFKNGKLIATAAPIDVSRGISVTAEGRADEEKRLQLQWIPCSEGNMSFSIDQAIQGDILMRCRHVGDNGSRVSMFRVAFHTGYVPSGDILRLTKAQLDGPTADNRFDDEFFIDLVFSPATASELSSASEENPETSASTSSSDPDNPSATLSKKFVDVKNVFTSTSVSTEFATAPDTFEALLNKDESGFWDLVSTRKIKSATRRSRKFDLTGPTSFSIFDDGSSSSNNNGKNISGSIVNSNQPSSAPTSGTVIQASLVTKNKNSSLTDEELILQTANMNGDGERLSINHGGELDGNPNNNSDILDEDMEEFIRNLSAEAGLSPIENPRKGNSNHYTSGGGEILSPNTINAVVKDELDALEELERVLGLDDVKASGNHTRASIENINRTEHATDDNADATWLDSNFQPNSQPVNSASSINLDDLDDIVGDLSSTSPAPSGNSAKSKDNIEEQFAQEFNDIEKYFESLESPSKKSSNS